MGTSSGILYIKMNLMFAKTCLAFQDFRKWNKYRRQVILNVLLEVILKKT